MYVRKGVSMSSMNELSPLRQEDYQAMAEQVKSLIKERDELRRALSPPIVKQGPIVSGFIKAYNGHAPAFIIGCGFTIGIFILFCFILSNMRM